ncbi:MAG: ATP-grasp domain-containing protein [bacterium]
MVPRLNVALVYNMKKDSVGDGSNDGLNDDEDSTHTTSSPTKQEKTNHDTYAEWDTEDTILAVKAALEEQHDVTMIEADTDAFQKFLQIQPDIVFNIAEGLRGPSREAQIPAMLDMLGIPYTGSDPLTLGICLDKSRAKEILSHHRIPTPEFRIITRIDELQEFTIPFPCIVKPLHEGSSKGVVNASVVKNEAELHEQVTRVLNNYHEPALVEKFLSGREFTVALLGNDGDLHVLPIIEIHFNELPEGANPIYSYEAKWVWDLPDHPIEMYSCPAKVGQELEQKIIETCRKTFKILNCRDWCRIDLRLDDAGTPHIIELNPLPGILPNPDEHSAFPMAARAAGISYNEMLCSVLGHAIRRQNIN